MNIKEFNPSNIKIVEKSSKNIPIYYIGYVTMKIDLKFYSVNLCTLFLVKWLDILKKLMEITI